MLAVTLENPVKQLTVSQYQMRMAPGPRSSSAPSEVRIYDAVAGHCLQSVLVRAVTAVIKWSSSLDMISKWCQYELFHPGGANPAKRSAPSLTGRLRERGTTVRILEPALQRVMLVEPENILDFCMVGDACGWSSCGTFLLTSYYREGDRLCRFGTRVHDPHTLEYVFKAPDAMSTVSWGSSGPPGAEDRVLHAYLPHQGTCVNLWQEHGMWQAGVCHCRGHTALHDGCIAPNAETVVGVRRPSQYDGRHCFHGHPQCSISHHDCTTQEGHAIATEFMCGGSGPQLQIAWARFPCGWPQLHAYVHKASSKALQRVVLVDARAHKVLGSWTAVALKSQALGRPQRRTPEPEILTKVAWAPSGRHLAVFCYQQWVLVMSFKA